MTIKQSFEYQKIDDAIKTIEDTIKKWNVEFNTKIKLDYKGSLSVIHKSDSRVWRLFIPGQEFTMSWAMIGGLNKLPQFADNLPSVKIKVKEMLKGRLTHVS